MKKIILVCIASLLSVPMFASAGKGLRDVLIERNAGNPLVGVDRQRGSNPCTVQVDADGVYINFRNTNLDDGIRLPWASLKKVADLPNVIGYNDKDNSICKHLNNGKCSGNSTGTIGIEYRPESSILLQARYVNEFGTVDSCIDWSR